MIIDSGSAAIIAAGIAAVVSLASLLVSIRTERERLKLEKQLSLSQDIQSEARDHLRRQLADFYDPVFALLKVNGDVFDRLGPRSESRWQNLHTEDEAARIWATIVSDVIIPNNDRLSRIIESNLHLLAEGEEVKLYLEFLTHAHAYQIFVNDPFEAYSDFQFPPVFPDHVHKQREALRRRLLDYYSLPDEGG